MIQFCFAKIKLFYITLTIDAEVSLHSWFFWPTVRRRRLADAAALLAATAAPPPRRAPGGLCTWGCRVATIDGNWTGVDDNYPPNNCFPLKQD